MSRILWFGLTLLLGGCGDPLATKAMNDPEASDAHDSGLEAPTEGLETPTPELPGGRAPFERTRDGEDSAEGGDSGYGREAGR
jgi:hypothetical protein